MAKNPHSLGEVVDGLEHLAEDQSKISIGDMLDEFGARSFGPVLFFLPLLELSPLGGIPGVPTAIAITIGLIALQMLFGKKHVWLPDFIQKRSIESKHVEWAMEKLEGAAGAVDHQLHRRLVWFTGYSGMKLIALIVIGLCAMVPPLEVLPFASSVPMLAVASFGLALMSRDGLLALISIALSGGSLYLLYVALGSSSGGG